MEQVHYLWARLKQADVTGAEPPSGHAVFWNRVIDVFGNRQVVKGLKMTYERPSLRFFTARFELL